MVREISIIGRGNVDGLGGVGFNEISEREMRNCLLAREAAAEGAILPERCKYDQDECKTGQPNIGT